MKKLPTELRWILPGIGLVMLVTVIVLLLINQRRDNDGIALTQTAAALTPDYALTATQIIIEVTASAQSQTMTAFAGATLPPAVETEFVRRGANAVATIHAMDTRTAVAVTRNP